MMPPDSEARVASWGEKLWEHSNPESTAMYRFLQETNKKHALQLKSYYDLYQWSIDNVSSFWEDTWHYLGVQASTPYSKVIESETLMFPRPTFFEGARMNFAENLLFPANAPNIPSDSPALVEATETTRDTMTWAQLRSRVATCQAVLRAAGVGINDRVAGYVGNHANAVIVMLATTSLGAIWTAVSPDSGVSMVLDRMRQIDPKVLFVDDGQVYNGKSFGVLEKVVEILRDLSSVQSCFVFDVIHSDIIEAQKSNLQAEVQPYADAAASLQEEPKLHFEQLPADHPVYILYSSGTTGAPKCIVHGAIGTLLQHKKEHVLHCSIKPGSRVFYFTTCTWMMWHWLISGLASGATLILYDGSPMRYRSPAGVSETDDCAVPRLIDELQIEHFGTSAKYLSILEQKSIMPREKGCSMSTLRAIYNTASPLAPSTFRYVYKAFGPDVNLGSITGGTDIISLFGAACPLTPVYAGEVQVPGLGMAIKAYDSASTAPKDVTSTGEPGDLVCVKPFICQPVAFWAPDGGLESETGKKKYRSSYFERFDGIWHHGDFVQFNPKTGGMIMLGRSDGVLNPAGVRFGSAEIYNVLLKHFAGEIADGLCVGRKREKEMDETVILFVKMDEGKSFGPELADAIKKKIRSELSARHVPAIVDETPDIPVTVNGKKVEGAIKQILSGSKVKTSASVANADVLDFYRRWAEQH